MLSKYPDIRSSKKHKSIDMYHTTLVCYLLVHETMENEDEESLQGVQYCEQVRHNNRMLIDVEQTEGPGQTQQDNQHKSSFQPRSTRNIDIKL